ncbi:pentapeptide repeat-containing protein [Mangrovihabitans endophyticus]|uniref:NACHT domain-containing protein n=1 Tax=Mangrovihabitans endophyticus TaxID=1751298 RepID=A0A8J3C4V3_9ACTN|nr:pentapeptide repeat-containing protein [Mangrovihabitans endophyticus]GGL15291.1 hypothetical protein GCM10012284_57420 [Mangrovihabitans endophyticus]
MEILDEPAERPMPDPQVARSKEEFASCLLALKAWSGRSFREIATISRKTRYRISTGTTENLTSGRVVPQERSLIGFLYGCGLSDPAQQEPWIARFANLYPPQPRPGLRSASHKAPAVGFDIDMYLAELDRIFDESGIKELFVSPKGYLEKQDVDVDVDGYIDEWLQAPSSGPLAVLGDYGTGKSWLCLRLAKRLADQYRRTLNSPLPLLIGFKRFEPRMDIEQLVRTHLFDSYGVEVHNPAELRRALGTGRLLLILDGLDEMVKALGERTALVAYSRLVLSSGIPRALITCRTHYFYSGSEQRELLMPTPVMPGFDLLHLRMFGPHEMTEFIRRRFDSAEAEAVLRFIASTYNLTELCTRPVLLSLVCQSHDQLPDFVAAASSADLYDAYTNAWLHRELSSGRLMVAPDLVMVFFEDLAERLVTQKTMVIDVEQLKVHLSMLLDRASLPRSRWKEVERQLITSTFVSRIRGDAWQFAHRSFQEYFYARKFFRWESEFDGEGIFPVIYTPVWHFIAQMALREWTEQKARKWITPRTGHEDDPTLTETTLRAAAAYWLLTNRCRGFPSAGIMLDSVELTDIDLSNLDLSNSDFHGSDLSRSKLTYSILRGCNLFGTRFAGCDIGHADFRGAEFSPFSREELKHCNGYRTAIFD